MKKHLLYIAIVFFNLTLFGQTFTNDDSADQVTNSGTDCASITVSGVPGSSALSDICVDITSNYDANLTVYVTPPSGGNFPLSSGNGSSGDNYSNTCFSPLASQSIEGSSAPFNGSYVAEGCLWTQNLSSTNGTWQVCVSGAGTGSNINLTSAELTFGPAAGLGVYEAADLCANATPICADNGFNGSTSACYNVEPTSPLCGGMSIENSSWLKFVASSTSVVMTVTVGNCNNNDGIQFVLYTTTNCSSFAYAGGTSANCYYQLNPGVSNVTFTSLTPGQTYYWMIDGFAGDDCDFLVDVQSGVEVTDIVSSNGDTFCLGGSTTLSINGSGNPPTGYTWYEGATVIGTGATVVVNPSTVGSHTYSVDVLGACGPLTTLNHTITVTSATTPTFAARPPICAGASMTALPTTSTNGVTGTWSPALNNTATTTYTFAPTSGLCATATTMTIVVNTAPSINLTSVAATASQTVCQNIPITNIVYAVGGSATGASTSGLPAGVTGNYIGGVYTISGSPTATGTFNYTVTTSGGSCGTTNASGSIIVDPTPTISVPSSGNVCQNSSLNLTPNTGGTWSSSNTSVATITNGGVVTGVGAGTATMTFTNTLTGCSSSAASGLITVFALPSINTSLISPVNPSTCGTNIGSITGITATGAPALSYSWNSTPAQTGLDLTGVIAGSYSLTVTDGNTCTSSAGPFTLTDPTPPATPTVSVASGSSLCAGGSFTLEVDSPIPGATYNWTSSPSGYTNTGTSITITNAVAGTITYTAVPTLAGCVGSGGDAPITVSGLPLVDILTPQVLNCDNSTVTLDGSNSDQTNTTFQWSVVSGGPLSGTSLLTDTETTDDAGVYTLEVTNSVTTCVNTANITVTDNYDTPTSDIVASAGGQIDCSNASVNLDGTGSTNDAGGTSGITYTWSATSGGSAIATGTSHSTSTAGDFYLTIEETSSGCTHETMVSVTSNTTNPAAIVTNNNPLSCDSTSILLIGSTSTPLGNVTYEWEDNTPSSPIGTNSSVSVSTAGNYSLTVTDNNNGCEHTTPITVTENVTLPSTVVISPVEVTCYNPTAELNGQGSSQGANYTYLWTTSGGLLIGDTDLDTAATVTAGTYNLQIEDITNGCVSDADVVVSINNTPPVADAGSAVPFICGVTTVALDGSASTGAGINYSWTGPGVITGGGTATPSVNTVGTFTLTVTGSNGCTDVSTVAVTPNTAIPFADAGSDTTITCNNPLPVVLDGSNSDTGMDYAWTTLTGNIVSGAATTAPSVDQAAGYQLTVTDPSNNCIDRDTVFVIMDTLVPTIDMSGTTSLIFTCTSNAQVLLDGSNSVDNSTSGDNLTYVWSTTTGNIVSSVDSVATVDGAGDYLLQITGANGCTSISGTPITVSSDTVSPSITIAPADDLDCIGTPVIVDASTSTGSNETYAWSNGDNTNTSSITTPGMYTLTVTSDNGCTAIDSVEIFNTTGPVADFTATPITGNLPLNVDFIDNSIGNNLGYDWNFGDGNNDTIANPSNVYTELGDYTALLTVTDAQGCSDTLSINIHVEGESVLIIPNVFSPNGDGNNDVLNLKGTNIVDVSGVVMNRWGQVIFEWSAIEAGWDGRTTSGMEASEGTYFYIVKATGADGKEYEFNGPIQLVR